MEVSGGGPMAVEGMPMPASTPRSRPDKKKHKTVLESEAPKRMRWRLFLAPPVFEGGSLESNVFLPGSGHLLPSIMVHQGVPKILWAEVRRLQEEVKSLQEEVWVAWQECDKVAWARDTLLCDCNASLKLWKVQAEEIKQLWARLMREAAESSTGILGFMVPSVQKVEELVWGLCQVDESESRWQEWLLREIARARLESVGAWFLFFACSCIDLSSGWAREHWLLLNSLSLGVSYMVEELAGQAMTPGVVQGAGRLSRMMETHHHRTFVEAGSWLEAFVDGLQTPPLLEKIVQMAWKPLEAEFGPGGQEEMQEGQGGGD
ncbi:hypothetical protein C0992_001714 [Termitomyces sp. T32_za158]|nr:hypothetical protein C0992_001714 [Termitomyces sp. T32_za158]